MRNYLFISVILLCLPQINFAQTGNWVYVNDGSSCSAFGSVGSCSDGRHEASYVEVGDKFVLLGGREDNGRVNIYDPVMDTWTVGATPPISLHHFQAVEYHGMVLVVGSMTGNCCNEPSTEKIYLYDLDTDTWHDGPDIPDSRERGGAGCVQDIPPPVGSLGLTNTIPKQIHGQNCPMHQEQETIFMLLW